MAANMFLIMFLFIKILISQVYGSSNVRSFPGAIDLGFHESILDPEECDRQVRFIRSNSLLQIQFADAGIRTPRGILTGNTVDFGNYHQCLGINHQLEDMEINGKYCSILVPYSQSLELPQSLDISRFNPSLDAEDNKEFTLMHRIMLAMSGEFDAFDDRTMPESILSGAEFRLAVCVPRPCSTQQAITSLLFNVTAVGFEFTEDFCRVPDDKPWVAADTCIVVIFSIIGFLTLLSTTHDLTVRFILKKDIKEINPIYQSFSVYTNGQRIMNFSAGSGSMQCVDGIRAIAMVWVIMGHSFSTQLFTANPIESYQWLFSAESLWMTSATITVDTFFTLGGILLVYTAVGKMNGSTFLKNLHWFYLNRVVRILPLLATAVLFQAAFYNRIMDGPSWSTVVTHTNRCRRFWWSTLLNVQNYVNPRDMCVSHSWYVAIDMQLYFISPLVLYWVLIGNRKQAWIALFTGLFVILAASTIYNFILNLPPGTMMPSRPGDVMDYLTRYYFNTLTRASPFFVGMIYGYLLHIHRGKKVELPWVFVTMLWASAAVTVGTTFYGKYSIKQFDWDNQLVDNMMNSFMRPMWGASICWLIFACVHGYAGPINWFLSLDIWRLPARLAYGMYLFHYPLMFTINGSEVAPVYFSVARFIFKYASHQVLALIVSFILTLLIDAPVSYLFKRLTDTVQKKRKPLVPAARDNGSIKEADPKCSTMVVQNDEHKTQ